MKRFFALYGQNMPAPLIGPEVGGGEQMKARRLWCVLLLLAQLASFPAWGQAALPHPPTPQIRGFWVDDYHDALQTPALCDQLLARVRAAHMNAVFVEVRTRADAEYASHYEPWAPDNPQHFDALAYLCQAAHTPGQPYVQVHAWANACSVGGDGRKNSLVSLHPDWLSLSDTGADYDGEATKVDLGNPAAADWTFRVFLDLVRHYKIDGLHFDAIRYGGVGKMLGHWGYNPVSVARYNAHYGTSGQPVWNDPRWMQWRRDQVTALVRRVSVSAHALKPHLIISAATICWGDGPHDVADYHARSAAYTEVFADWLGWLHDGLLDLNCPMTYFTEAQLPHDWTDWSQFIKNHQYGRISALGVGVWLNPLADSFTQIASAAVPTSQGHAAAGVTLFSYASTDRTNGQIQQYDPAFYKGLLAVFPTAVPPPPMPWLDKPAMGTIMGMLLQGRSLTPLGVQRIVMHGSYPFRLLHVKQIAMTDGNGFYAINGLPPGHYIVNVTVAEPRHGKQSTIIMSYPVDVWAGKTTTLNCFIHQNGDSFSNHPVAGIGLTANGKHVVVTKAVVLNGSDRLGNHFYIADDFGRPWLRVDAPHLFPPTIIGDVVAVSGTLHHSPTGAFIDAKAVRLVGARLVKSL